MSFVEILLIGIGLSMDAFSVSICKGLTTKKFSWKMALTCGLWFGLSQALMPLIGYFLGSQFEQYITAVDHWIAFGLLFLIGANMIREALSKKNDVPDDNSLDFKTMLLLAIATLRLYPGENMVVGTHHRCHHLPLFGVRCQDWKCIRFQV